MRSLSLTSVLPVCAFGLLLCGAAEAASLSAVLTSQDSIVGASLSTNTPGYYVNAANGQVGTGGGGADREARNLVLGFTLPVLDAPFSSASFRISIASVNQSSGAVTVALYGLNVTNPESSGATLFRDTPNDTTQALLLSPFSSSSTDAAGNVKSADVSSFIASFYNGGVTPSQQEVFLRLNLNEVTGTGGVRRVTFNPAAGALTINSVPEPSTLVAAVSGLATLALLRRRR